MISSSGKRFKAAIARKHSRSISERKRVLMTIEAVKSRFRGIPGERFVGILGVPCNRNPL
jgi:hypothetical protein